MTKKKNMGFVNTIGRLFTPQNTFFYTMFEKIAETVEEMGLTFKELINAPGYEEREKIMKRIEDLEHKNDNDTHQLFTELSRNFITPFDREDIHALTSVLDDVCDGIYASAKRIQLYNVDTRDAGIQKLTQVIEKGTQEIKKVVHGLRHKNQMKMLAEALVKINSLENEGDDAYDQSIVELFDHETDMKNVIKKREIYQVMEKTSDKMEDVANVIESILIKYS